MSLPWQIPGGQQVQRSVHRIGGSEGGPVIVRGDGAMQSENFVTGVSGWQFDAQGNLEANDGTFRGTLDAADGTFSGDLDAAGGTFTGDISAASGTFTGALKIGTDPFSFNASGGAIWVGDAVFGSAPFRVSPTGAVYASSYNLVGGTIQQGSMTINSGEITNASHDGTGTIVSGGLLKSSNFATGLTGWQLNGDGDLEVNNIDARGQISSGLAPAQRITMGSGGNALIQFYTGDGDELDFGYINVDVDNSGPTDFAFINIVAPSMAAGDRCYIDLRHLDNGSRGITLYADQIGMAGTLMTVVAVGQFLENVFISEPGKRLFLDKGTAVLPPLSFFTDQNTGIYSPAADQLGITTGGVLRFLATNTGMFAPGMATTTAAGLVVERFGSLGNEIYAETSSGELKANQRPAPDMVPRLLALEPRMWDAMSKASDGTVSITDEVRLERNRGVTFDRPGFIVEEMAGQWPEAVIFDDDAQPVGLDRMALITALVQAAQQFDARLSALE